MALAQVDDAPLANFGHALGPEALRIADGLYDVEDGALSDWIGGREASSSPASSASLPNPSIPGFGSALAVAAGTPPPRLDLVGMFGRVSEETAGSLAIVGQAVQAQLDELVSDGQELGEHVDTAALGRDPARFALEQEAHIEEVRRRAAASRGFELETQAANAPIGVSQPHPPRPMPPPRIAPPPASSSAPSVQGFFSDRTRSSGLSHGRPSKRRQSMSEDERSTTREPSDDDGDGDDTRGHEPTPPSIAAMSRQPSFDLGPAARAQQPSPAPSVASRLGARARSIIQARLSGDLVPPPPAPASQPSEPSPLVQRSQRSSQPKVKRKKLRHTLPEHDVILPWDYPPGHERALASLERLEASNARHSR